LTEKVKAQLMWSSSNSNSHQRINLHLPSRVYNTCPHIKSHQLCSQLQALIHCWVLTSTGYEKMTTKVLYTLQYEPTTSGPPW